MGGHTYVLDGDKAASAAAVLHVHAQGLRVPGNDVSAVVSRRAQHAQGHGIHPNGQERPVAWARSAISGLAPGGVATCRRKIPDRPAGVFDLPAGRLGQEEPGNSTMWPRYAEGSVSVSSNLYSIFLPSTPPLALNSSMAIAFPVARLRRRRHNCRSHRWLYQSG
jgi:hypothetical protein